MNAQEPQLRYQCEDLDGNRSPSAQTKKQVPRQGETRRAFSAVETRPLEAERSEQTEKPVSATLDSKRTAFVSHDSLSSQKLA